jgi:hypothetical protein
VRNFTHTGDATSSTFPVGVKPPVFGLIRNTNDVVRLLVLREQKRAGGVDLEAARFLASG